MATVNDTIAFALKTSQMMLQRLVTDLAPHEYLHRPTPKANCAAWLLGHLVLTERSALRRVGAPLPEIPPGFEQRFSREAGCPEAAEFGDVSGLAATFNDHRERLIAAIKSAPAELLDRRPEKPSPMFGNLAEAAQFIALHTVLHAGQISTIRRSLGRPPLM